MFIYLLKVISGEYSRKNVIQPNLACTSIQVIMLTCIDSVYVNIEVDIILILYVTTEQMYSVEIPKCKFNESSLKW